MRIIYLTGASIPGDSLESVHAVETASKLVEFGHRVEIVGDRKSGQSYKEVIGGVKIVRAHMRSKGRLVPMIATRRLAHFFRRQPDVIIESHHALGGVGVVLSFLKDVPLVLEVDAPKVEIMLSKRPRPHLVADGMLRLWNRVQFARSAAIVASSETLVPPVYRSKTVVADWGVNTERFSLDLRRSSMTDHIRQRHDLRGHTVVGFHGTLNRKHGAHSLPEIFDHVRDSAPDVRFLIIGEGPLRESLEAEFKRRSMTGVVCFAGEPELHEKPYWLAAVDIAVAPFQSAGGPAEPFGVYWPLTHLYEALACGAATAAYDFGRARAILSEGCGRVVPGRSVEDMADAVIELAEDEGNVRAMGEKAACYAQREFDVSICAKKLERILLDVASKPRPRFRLF